MRDAKSAIKIQEIGAAPEEDVLTVVDDLKVAIAFRNGIGGGPTAGVRTRFIHVDLESGVSQGRSRSETGQTSADDDD